MKERIHTRDKIMHTALELFSKKGYEGVSIMDITKEVGINKATFYSHYKSKAQLLEKLFDYFKGKICSASPNPDEYNSMLKSFGAEKMLTGGLNLYLEKYTEPDMSRIIRLAQMEQYRNSLAREFMKEYFYKVPFTAAENVFKELKRMHLIKDIDIILLSSEFQSVFMHYFQEYILEDFYGGDVETIKTKMRKHIHFFCKKILEL